MNGEVRIETSPEVGTIRVTDDGRGIEDFSALLTVGRTGWDAETRAEESPFGMGFFSALISGSGIRVTSTGGTIEGSTEDILGGMPIEIDRGRAREKGTEVAISGATEIAVVESVAAFVSGFPIPVYYNGWEIPRPAALDSLERFSEVPGLGVVSLPGIHRGKFLTASTKDVLLYLQGQPIDARGFGYRTRRDEFDFSVIVHLDPKVFRGRMPDRSVLVGGREDAEKARKMAVDSYAVHFKRFLSELGEDKFVERYGEAILDSDSEPVRDILKRISVCPRRGLLAQGRPEIPVGEYGSSDENLSNWDGLPVRREQIESGEVRIYAGRQSSWKVEEVIAANFAHICGFLVPSPRLPWDHWASEAAIALQTDSDEEKYHVDVRVVGEKSSQKFGSATGNTVEVVLCEKVVMTCADIGVTVEVTTEIVPVDSGVLAFPVGAEVPLGYPLRQVVSYESEEEMERDRPPFIALLKSMRDDDPSEIIRDAVLVAMESSGKMLGGRSFLVRVGQTFNSTVAISDELERSFLDLLDLVKGFRKDFSDSETYRKALAVAEKFGLPERWKRG